MRKIIPGYNNILSKVQRLQTIVFVCFFLLYADSVFAQSDPVINSISTSLNEYAGNVIEEKIFVHTDKQSYQAGELMWFNVFTVDSRFHRPIALSKVVYLELLDNQNKPVLQTKVSVDSGQGSGSLFLPVSLSTGVYRLRSYTNWMKNFSEEGFFTKEITVINARKTVPGNGEPNKLYHSVKFFPEGGNLVSGLPSRVGFKIIDQFGKGSAGTGYILEDEKDTIVSFNTHVFGMGSFMFTPREGKRYSAGVKLNDGKLITAKLPEVFPNGYTMQMSTTNNSISVKVNCNIAVVSKLYLIIQTRLSLKHAVTAPIVNGTASFDIPVSIPGEGVSVITIFDESKKPVCERLYFKYPATDGNITIGIDNKVYETRKKIDLNILSTEKNKSKVSLAVYRVDSLKYQDETGIKAYLWLQSEIKGRLEFPSYYFKETSQDVTLAMENLLLTQGWRRYNWTQMLAGEMPLFNYEPEYKGVILNTRAIHTVSGRPGKNIQVYAGAPGSFSRFVTNYTNDSGYLKLEIPGLYGTAEVVVQTDPKSADSIYRVDVFSPYSEKFSGDSLPQLMVTAADTADILEQHIASQVQYLFGEENLNRFDTLAIDTTVFFQKPDHQYLLDDYTRFTTMEEVLREYVRLLTVTNRDNNFQLILYDVDGQQVMGKNPLVLLDGIPIFDMNKLMQVDPLKVRRLQVVHKRYNIGNITYDGIMNFTTFTGTLEQYPLDRNAVVVDYEGLQLKREFYSPDYGTLQSVENIPDFRTVLYWNGDIKLTGNQQAKLPFFSSDIKGRYIAVAQGITEDGHCLEATAAFDVR